MFRPAAASPPCVFNGVQTAEKLSRFAVRPTCPALFCLFYCHNSWDVFFFFLYIYISLCPTSESIRSSVNKRCARSVVGTVASTPLVSRCAKLKYFVSPLHGVTGIFFSLPLSLSPQSQQHASFSRLNGPRGGSLGCTIPLVFFFSSSFCSWSTEPERLPGWDPFRLCRSFPVLGQLRRDEAWYRGADWKNRFLLKKWRALLGGKCLLSDRG